MMVMGELRGVGILLGIGVGDGLVERAAHGNVVGQIGGQSPIEVGGPGLQMCGEATVLHGQIVVFLLVHFLVDDVLLGDAQGATGATLMDLGCPTGGFHSGFEASITSS